MKTHTVKATRNGDIVFSIAFKFDDDVDPANAIAREPPTLTGDVAVLRKFDGLLRQAIAGDLLLWHELGDVGEIDLRRLRAVEALQTALARDLNWTLRFDIDTQLSFVGDVPADAVA